MPVSLKVHRNRAAKRQATELRKGMREAVKSSGYILGDGVCGYALVAWSADGTSVAFWDGVDTLGPCPAGEYAKHVINRTMAAMDAADVQKE